MKERWRITTPSYDSDIINESLKVSPWCGHRNFIYDLLNFLEPQSIIELGTHYGCSFFAMCQSMKDNSLTMTHLYAVDTWKGDEQAGFYDEAVWEIVNKTKETYFKDVNTKFVRMLFEDAVKEFEDESFDIIHIDGLHTYEAVSHDFDTWLPKLKRNGIILFHDIFSEKKYGTNVFWQEIVKKYPYYFQFDHSWGLGILFPKGNELFEQLKKQNFEDKLLIYKYKAQKEYQSFEIFDLTQMANERYMGIQEQSKMINERDKTIKEQADLLNERYNAIENQSQMINERDKTIKEQADLLNERYNAIENQSQMINERDKTIKEQADLLNERYNAIENQSQMIDERDKIIIQQNQKIHQITQQFSNLNDEYLKMTSFINTNCFVRLLWKKYKRR